VALFVANLIRASIMDSRPSRLLIGVGAADEDDD
jgi:hypothetical protein